MGKGTNDDNAKRKRRKRAKAKTRRASKEQNQNRGVGTGRSTRRVYSANWDAGTRPRLNKIIGERLRSTRLGHGMTQRKVAEKLGIHAAFYARIERGSALPGVETFNKLCSLLAVSADHLLGHEQQPAIMKQRELAMSKVAQSGAIRWNPVDPAEISYIAERAQKNRELRLLVLKLLKLRQLK